MPEGCCKNQLHKIKIKDGYSLNKEAKLPALKLAIARFEIFDLRPSALLTKKDNVIIYNDDPRTMRPVSIFILNRSFLI